MHDINNLPAVILIGRQTETGVEEIAFDCSGWLEKWPGMQISILAMRPGESDAYPAAIRKEGAVVVWEVNASDTAIAGDGYAELIGLVDGKRKLSRTIDTRIVSIKSNVVSEVPEAAKPWVDQVLEAAKRAEDAAERAEDAEAGLFQEDDPTVPAWAKQPEKPKYTADEVGAQPKGDYALRSEIPAVPVKSVNGKTGAVQLSAGDVGAADASQTKSDIERLEADIANRQPKGNYLTTEADPTVPAWAKQPNKPSYTADEVGAQPKGNYALKSEIPSVPVQSVNGKTGAVQLSASDVGALPAETEIPEPYTLPTASAEVKGGVKVGEGLQMQNGVLSVAGARDWNQIENVITTEKVAALSLATEDYKSFRLYLETPAAESDYGVNIKVGGTVQFNTKMSTSSVVTFVAEIDIIGDYSIMALASAQSIYYQGSQKNWWWKFEDAKTIVLSATEFPVGTKLIAYAR